MIELVVSHPEFGGSTRVIISNVPGKSSHRGMNMHTGSEQELAVPPEKVTLPDASGIPAIQPVGLEKYEP
jgi:hypothetical protein